MSDDEPGDHGAQRVVDRVIADNEWEEVEEDDAEGAVPVVVQEDDEEEEEDLGPLPPMRHRMTSGTREERGQSSLRNGGTQVQGRVPSSSGRQSGEIPSSQASQHSNSRGSGSWAHGGTPVQRRTTSSLGRRTRDMLSSEASRDGPQDKRLRALGADFPSSPPTTGTITLSQGSEAPSENSQGKRVTRKYLKKEHVPRHNEMVTELALKFLQAEVLACQPWPNPATIETLVRRSWANSLKYRDEERKNSYPGSGRLSNEVAPTKEPDEVSSGIVSTSEVVWRAVC